MTARAMKKIEALRAVTIRYSPRVQKNLSQSGKKSDSAVAQSAAKYYVALKKLASE